MLPVEKRLNYQIFGEDSSPKLVFLHGIMGQGRNWASIAKKFAKNFQCLIYDQRGHGRSAPGEVDFEFSDLSRDLRDLLLHLDWTEPIYLVGHSMGGRVALNFATDYPDLVKKLVIVDIGPSANWDSMSAVLEKLNSIPVPFSSRSEARAFLEGPFLTQFPNKMVMEFFYSNLVQKNQGMDWIFSKKLVVRLLETSRHKDYWGEFKTLNVATLFIRGELSEDLKESEFLKVLENNDRIQGQTIKGAGHWVHAEKPIETLRVIGEFFNIATESKQ